jgi:hypothetical protein
MRHWYRIETLTRGALETGMVRDKAWGGKEGVQHDNHETRTSIYFWL